MRYRLFSIQQLHYNAFIKEGPSKQKESLLIQCKLMQSALNWNHLLQPYYCSLHDLIEHIYPKITALIIRKQLYKFDLLEIAFASGKAEIIQQVLASFHMIINEELFKKAILCDNPTSVKFLENYGLSFTHDLMVYAAENGCLNVLKYCVSLGFKPNKDTLDDTALYGDLATIQYFIHDLHIQPDLRTLDYTIIGSSLKNHKNRAATQYLFNLITQNLNVQNKITSLI